MRWLVVVVVVVTFVACGRSRPALPREPGTIEVVDAGALPRRRVTFGLVAGTVERMETTLKVRIRNTYETTVMETGQRFTDLPSVRVIARVEVVGATPGGDAQLAAEIEDVAVLDDVVDARTRALASQKAMQLRGLRTTWRMQPNGVLSDFKASSMRDLMRASGVVFPTEEIGVGAVWRQLARVSDGDVEWDRTTTFTLRDLTETAAVVDYAVTMYAGSQALHTEPNATMQLTSGTGSASGRITVPLHGLVPTGDGKSTSEMKVLIVQRRLRLASTIDNETIAITRPAL